MKCNMYTVCLRAHCFADFEKKIQSLSFSTFQSLVVVLESRHKEKEVRHVKRICERKRPFSCGVDYSEHPTAVQQESKPEAVMAHRCLDQLAPAITTDQRLEP